MALFISIDGVDGVGKTTACKTLAEEMGAHYLKSPLAPFDEMRGHVDKQINPMARYYFYMAANHHASRVIAQILDQGQSVVCDRYYFSTFAYHAAMDPRIRGIFTTEGLLIPTLSILLIARPEIRWQRLAKRFTNQDYDKFLERDAALQQAASDTFSYFSMDQIDTSDTSAMQVVQHIHTLIKSR